MTSDYQITFTYNLLLHSDSSRLEGDEGAIAELADLLREHFRTPVPEALRAWTGEDRARGSGLFGKALRAADPVADA